MSKACSQRKSSGARLLRSHYRSMNMLTFKYSNVDAPKVFKGENKAWRRKDGFFKQKNAGPFPYTVTKPAADADKQSAK